MPTIDKDLRALKKLRWVSTVKKEVGFYVLRTKKDVFVTKLTHSIRAGRSDYDNGFVAGSRLKEEAVVPMPSYRVYLRNNGFMFSLANKPKNVIAGLMGVIPQYDHLTNEQHWKEPLTPCYGNGRGDTPQLRGTAEDYRYATTWLERAQIAAIYLQSAEPHYGQTWYRTAWAYRLGLIGDEYRDDLKVKGAAVVAGT